MTNPTTASPSESVWPAVLPNAPSNLQRLGTMPSRGLVFLALALGLASCGSNANSGGNGGSSSGGATSSGGSSAGASGSHTGGTTASGAGGSTSTSGTGGGSGGATAASGGSGGTPGLGGSSSGGESGGNSGSGSGGKTGSGAGGILGSGGTIDSGAGGATKSGAGGGAGSVTTGGGGSVGAGGAGGSTAGTGGHSSSSGGAGGGSATGDAGSGSFALTSPDLVDGAHFDAKFTCASTAGTVGSLGNGINPELDWTGVPAGTASFAITFIDTTLGDTSPMGQHWAIWNIPATVTPKFPQGTTTLTGEFANAKQSGKFLAPCAQSLTNNMDDNYEFTIYALSTATLNITGTTVANALTALKAASPLGTAKLRGHAGLKGK